MTRTRARHHDDGHTWSAFLLGTGQGASPIFYCLHCAATESLEERRERLDLETASLGPISEVEGREIPLTSSERRVVELLRARLGEAVSLEQIAGALWPGRDVDSRIRAAVRAHIYTLRQKLRGGRLAIETQPGVGYRAHVAAPSLNPDIVLGRATATEARRQFSA